MGAGDMAAILPGAVQLRPAACLLIIRVFDFNPLLSAEAG